MPKTPDIIHRKGDCRPDGKFFWGYRSTCLNGEYWITREQFELWSERAEIRKQARLDSVEPISTPESRALHCEAMKRYRLRQKYQTDKRGGKSSWPRIPKTISMWRLLHDDNFDLFAAPRPKRKASPGFPGEA